MLPNSRTSLVLWLTGVPFERAVRYHKFTAALGVLSGLIHLLMVNKTAKDIFYSDVPTGTAAEVVPLYGALSFFTFSAMSLLAFEPIRRRQYQLFLLFHHLYIPAIVFLVLHVPYALVGFYPGIALRGNAGSRALTALPSATAAVANVVAFAD